MTSLDDTYVSIGISFYNAEDTLLDAVRSIFAQTHKNWELILVNDGSTDRSLELAQSINDPRVRVYSDGKNRRLAARLNQITKLSKYDFIARMDADDLVSPTRLEKQLEVLLSNLRVDLVSTGVCSLTDEYEPVGIRCVPKYHSITANSLLSGRTGIVHASLLGRREWFSRNPYKENLQLGEDGDLWVRSYVKNDLRITFIPEPLYYYREDSSVTKDKLLASYAIQRRTIIYDAKLGFSLSVKAKAFVDSFFKTIAVRFFTVYALKIARGRRVHAPLAELERNKFINEIAYIKNFKISLNSVKSDV